jgi:hypothetical protein
VFLIAAVSLPLARVLYAAQSTANDNTARQQALGLDTAVLAKIEAAAYSGVGLTAADLSAANTDDPGYSSAGGGTFVSIGTGAADLDGLFTIGGQSFNVVIKRLFWGDRNFKVVTWATWANGHVPRCPTTPGQPLTTLVPNAEKRVTVTATWLSPFSGTVAASESTVVYPGGLRPYQGTGAAPPAAGSPTASQVHDGNETTQRIYVSWLASGSAGCYGISWVTPDQAIYGTGLLADDDPGYVQAPPVAGTGTAVYALDDLPQNEPLTFFVTAYTADGTVSTVSTDTAPTVLPPTGPTVTGVTSTTCPSGVSAPCPYGAPGSTVSVKGGGTGFSAGASMSLVQDGQALSIGSCSASPCTLTLPTSGTSGPLTGTWSIVATSGGVSSPPAPASDFSFNPTITSLSPSSGSALTDVTVTGTNFLSGVTFTYTYPIGGMNDQAILTPTNCTPAPGPTVGSTSCTLRMPAFIDAQLAGAGQPSTQGTIVASTSGGSSPGTLADVFTYEAT